LLEQLGWFDPKFGMKGKQLGYGEETVLMIKAWQNNPNLSVYYDPSLYVMHYAPKQKMSIFFRLQQQYKTGKSQAYLWIPEDETSRMKKKAFFYLLRTMMAMCIKTFPNLFFRDRSEYPHWKNFIYENTSQYFASIGQKVRFIKDSKRGTALD
jgi:hypothetical protein